MQVKFVIIIAVIILLVVAAYYYYKKQNILPKDLVMPLNVMLFNSPYGIEPGHLVSVLHDIHTERDLQTYDVNITLYLPRDYSILPAAEIPFEDYFGVVGRTASVVKLERVTDDKVLLILRTSSN